MATKRKSAQRSGKGSGASPGASMADRQHRNRFILAILGVALIVVLTFMLSSPPTESKAGGSQNEEAGSGAAVDIAVPGNISFKKDGELTFMTSGGIEIDKIDIEIAQTPLETTQGLMYRSDLKHNEGMLFIFPVERPQSFWMKNTQIPLDIIFVNASMTIVTIRKDAVPFDESSYPSTEPAKFVVEVNAGYTSDNGISVGDKIKWTETL